MAGAAPRAGPVIRRLHGVNRSAAGGPTVSVSERAAAAARDRPKVDEGR